MGREERGRDAESWRIKPKAATNGTEEASRARPLSDASLLATRRREKESCRGGVGLVCF